jgi:predicted CXXCH cytochrome family protein
MNADTQRCTREHGKNAPVMLAVPGTELCRACHADFPRALTGIADIWQDLASGARRATDAQDVGFVQTSGHTDVGDMWRPQVTQIVTDATELASYLVRLTRDIRADAQQLTVAAAEQNPVLAFRIIARYVAHDLTYKLHGGLPKAIVTEALMILHRSRAALDAPYVRRVKLQATCAAEVRIVAPDGKTTDVACGGDLYAVLNPSSRGTSAVLCTRDPRDHRIPREQWLLLADQLQDIVAAQVEPARA